MTGSGPAAVGSKWKECMNEEVTIVQKEAGRPPPFSRPTTAAAPEENATKGKQNKKLFSGSGKRVYYFTNTNAHRIRRRKFLPRRSRVKQKC